MHKYIANAIIAVVLSIVGPTIALAQECPTTGWSPAFTAGGSVFGRIAAQWDQYFAAKADINNGVMCNTTLINPTIDGSLDISITFGTGLTATPNPITGIGTVSLNANCSDLLDSGTACTADTGTSDATLGFLNADKSDSGNNIFSGINKFTTVNGTPRTVAGTSDTLSAADCGKSVVYTSSSAVTVTTLANIISGTDSCAIAIYQEGTGAVSITAGAGAASVSPHSCTKTYARYATLGLFVEPNNPSTWVIMGDCIP